MGRGPKLTGWDVDSTLGAGEPVGRFPSIAVPQPCLLLIGESTGPWEEGFQPGRQAHLAERVGGRGGEWTAQVHSGGGADGTGGGEPVL